MTAAGVQNIDSTAYVPPSSSSPAPDGSLAGKHAADPQTADAQSQPSDFQSELELQQTGTKGADPRGSLKTGPEKPESGKIGKKRDRQQDDLNVSSPTPMAAADPQRPILPFTLTLAPVQADAQPDAKADLPAQPRVHAEATENLTDSAPQDVKAKPAPVAAGPQRIEARQSAASRQSEKVRQFAKQVEALQIPTSNVASATSDPSKAAQSAVGLPPLPQLSILATETQAQDENQTPAPVRSTTTSDSSQSQPVLPIELDLPAASSELVTTAVRETVESAPSSSSALAFAARVPAVAEKNNQSPAANNAPAAPVSGPQTSGHIPMRHAAMAQIIQNTVAGSRDDPSKKDLDAAFGEMREDDAGLRTGARIDAAMPQTEAVNQPASATAPAPAQPPTPTAHMEHVIEPSAVPPTSNRDIRVRVPDGNGGSTQVRFVESGGEVRVSVRTGDEGLAQSLRTHLNDLSQRLSDGGMPAEMWKPAANGASSQTDQHRPNQDGRGSGGQGSGAQSGQQDGRQKRPAWLEEMEASLHAE
jgi:hypothetical protein